MGAPDTTLQKFIDSTEAQQAALQAAQTTAQQQVEQEAKRQAQQQSSSIGDSVSNVGDQVKDIAGKIDLSKRYKTRGGADVRLYCTDARGAFPVTGHIINPIGEADTLATWTSTGMVSPSGRWSSGDLVEVAPYADIAIDDVVVTPSGAKAHFAGLAPDGRPRVWADGRTSHTAKASTCADVGWMTYTIVRKFFNPGFPDQVLETGVTLEEARAHCRDPESSSSTCKSAETNKISLEYGAWFDVYVEE